MYCQFVIMFSGTMGVCVSPCSLPGSGPMFHLGPRDMELGMGMFLHFTLYSLEACYLIGSIPVT